MQALQISYEKDSEDKTPPKKPSKLLYSDKIYTYSQKLLFLRISLTCSVFLIFSSIIQLCFLFSDSWTLVFGKIFFLSLIIMEILYGIFAFIVNIYIFRHEFKEIRGFYLDFGIKSLSFLFIFSAFMLVFKVILFFLFLIAFRYFPDPPIVQKLSFILNILEILAFAFSIFCFFAVEGSKSTVRILLYGSGLMMIILAFLLFFSSTKISTILSTEDELSSLIVPFAFKSLRLICIVLIIVVEIIFLFSVKRFDFWFSIGGNGTLILAILFALLNGILVKNLQKINEFFAESENCIEALKILDSTYLSTVECDSKYTELSNVPYLNCSVDQQAFVWESEGNWTKSACINTECCQNTLSLIYSRDIMAVYLYSLGIISFGVMGIASIYYLTSMYKNKQLEIPVYKHFNKLMAFIYILIPILGIIFLEFNEMDLPVKQPIFPQNLLTVNMENFAQYPANSTDYTVSCFLLSQYITDFSPKLSLSKCLHIIIVDETETCNDEMRVILLITNAEISIPTSYNTLNIRIYDKRSKNFAIAQKSYYAVDYLAFEGSVDNLKEFMQDTVEICPKSLFETISYSYSVYQISTSSFLIANSSDATVNSELDSEISTLSQKRVLSTDSTETSNTSSESGNASNISQTFASHIDFNLTALDLYYIIGKLVGNEGDSMEGANVCFTEENPEIGARLTCLKEIETDASGVFNLSANKLINNVSYAGYVQFLKAGYYPLQVELYFADLNRESNLNLGYINMSPVNNSVNWTNYTNSDDTESVADVLDYDPSENSLESLQLELDQITFGNLSLTILDMLTLERLDQIEIVLYDSTVDCENNLQDQSIGTFLTETGQDLAFYNMEYNTFTFFFSKEDYKTECLQITVSQPEKNQTVLLSPKLSENQTRISLQWENAAISLGIYLMFKSEDSTSKCVVSAQNKVCPGVEFTAHDSTSTNGSNAQIITIESFKNFSYLIYVREIISWELYESRIASNESINLNFLYYSQARLRYYVSELDLPVILSNGFSVEKAYNMTQVLAERDLAYLFLCIDGGKGDSGTEPENPWWTAEFYNKTDDVEYPESDICA